MLDRRGRAACRPVLRCGHGRRVLLATLQLQVMLRPRAAPIIRQASALRFGLGERDRDMGGVRAVLLCLGLRSLLFQLLIIASLHQPTAMRVFPKLLPILYISYPCHCYNCHYTVLTSSSGRWLRMWQWKPAKMREENGTASSGLRVTRLTKFLMLESDYLVGSKIY